MLEGLIELFRSRTRRPPCEMDKQIVARALEEAMQETIAEEQDVDRADELRRRAAARCLARMCAEGPRLVFTRDLPIQKSKTVVARRDHKPAKPPEVESFQAMLEARRRRQPALVIDNTPHSPGVRPAA